MEDSTATARPPRRGRSIVGPLLLISVGVLMLLNTTGMVSWNIWSTLWRFWPVILILFGLELILGRGNPWASGVLAILVLGAIAGLAFFSFFSPFGWSLTSPTTSVMTQEVVVPLEGAREARLTIKFAAGQLTLGPLTGDTGNLVQGSARGTGAAVVAEQGTTAQGERIDVTLQRSGSPRVAIGNNNNADRWTLNINPNVPLDLRVEGGASDANLDLRQLRVRDLSLEMGASSTRLTMPQNAGYTKAMLKSGMADLQVEIPQGVAARITARNAIGSLEVDQARFPSRGGVYQSPDYDTATNKVEMEIEAGMASVRVR